jgi:transposase
MNKEVLMSTHHFWLSDSQFERLRPLLPNKVRGVPRVDDRRVISGIIHVLKGGLMWRDAPSVYGPHKTLYNRFIRWSRAGVFDRIFSELAAAGDATETVMIDATHLKAHRTAASLLKKGLYPGVSDGRRAG